MSNPAEPILQRLRQLEGAKKRRTARAARRKAILDDFAGGRSRAEIATKLKVSVKTVSREIERALDAQRPLSNEHFVQLQLTRLHRTLGLLEPLLEEGQVSAATPMLAIFDRLERYHGLQRRPNPPLALTDERARFAEITPPAPHEAPVSSHSDSDLAAEPRSSGRQNPR